MRDNRTSKRVLAVASGGGHWVQLRRLVPALTGHEIVYVTTLESYRADVPGARFYLVNDANIRRKCRLVRTALRLAWIVAVERPEVVISTGAAPGYLAIRFGKLIGARTIWVDSMANVEELSLSGSKVARHADLWLTQWPHLACPCGPCFEGSVL